MAGDRPIFTNIPMLQEAGAKIGSALGDYQRRRKEEQYWNNLLSGVSTPAQMNTPIGREVWKKYLRNQLYSPLSQEGGYDVPLQDLDQRILQSQSFQTPEGYKDAEFFDKQRKHLYEQKKDYDQAIKNYEKETLEKYFTKAKRSPLYQDLVRVLIEYQKDKNEDKVRHRLRDMFRKVGIGEHRPISRKDIERVLEGRALELLDIKEKGGSNPSTVEFKAMINSFVNVLNDLEGNLQLLVPQAIQSRVANAYYKASKIIKPSDFRTLDKYKETLGKEAQRILKRDDEFDSIKNMGRALRMNVKDMIDTAAITPIFEEEFNLPKNQQKPLKSFSRVGDEERNVQPRDVSSSKPFGFNDNNNPFGFNDNNEDKGFPDVPVLSSKKPFDFSSENEFLSPSNRAVEEEEKRNNSEFPNIYELTGTRPAPTPEWTWQDTALHLLNKGGQGVVGAFTWLPEILLALYRKASPYLHAAGDADMFGSSALDNALDILPSLPKEEREQFLKDYMKNYYKPNPTSEEVLKWFSPSHLIDQGFQTIYDPNKVPWWGNLGANLLEKGLLLGAGTPLDRGLLRAIGHSAAKAAAWEAGELGAEALGLPPSIVPLVPFIAKGAHTALPKVVRKMSKPTGKLKIDTISVDDITNRYWKGSADHYKKANALFSQPFKERLGNLTLRRNKKAPFEELKGKTIVGVERAVDTQYNKVNKILKEYKSSEKNVKNVFLEEVDNVISDFKKEMMEGGSTKDKENILKKFLDYRDQIKNQTDVPLNKVIAEMKNWRHSKTLQYDPTLTRLQQSVDYQFNNGITKALDNTVAREIPAVATPLKKANALYGIHKEDQFLTDYYNKLASTKPTSGVNLSHKFVLDSEVQRDLKRMLSPEEYHALQKEAWLFAERMEKFNLAQHLRDSRREYKGGGRESWEGRIEDWLGPFFKEKRWKIKNLYKPETTIKGKKKGCLLYTSPSPRDS